MHIQIPGSSASLIFLKKFFHVSPPKDDVYYRCVCKHLFSCRCLIEVVNLHQWFAEQSQVGTCSPANIDKVTYPLVFCSFTGGCWLTVLFGFNLSGLRTYLFLWTLRSSESGSQNFMTADKFRMLRSLNEEAFLPLHAQPDSSRIKDNEKKYKWSLWSHNFHSSLYKIIYCFGFALLVIRVYLEDPCILVQFLKNLLCVSRL